MQAELSCRGARSWIIGFPLGHLRGIMTPVPTSSGLPRLRLAEFATVPEALDYAATGTSGANLFSGRGELVEALPYRDLRDQAVELAYSMLGARLRPGDLVAMIAETDGDFIRAFCACQYAGLVPAPMPLPAAFGGKDVYIAHIRRMIEFTQVSAALGPAAFDSWLQAAAEGLDLKFVGTTAQLSGIPSGSVELPIISPDQLCYVQFSSGSTRFPHGVAITHRALMNSAAGMTRDGLDLKLGDRCVSWLPMYHDMGLVGSMLTPLVSQITVDLLSTREFARRPLQWLELITRYGGTIAYSPSLGYELCARRAQTASIDALDLRNWRVAGIGGDMIRPGVLSAFQERFAPCGFRGEAFVASYGMAEATLALSFAPLGRGIETERLDVDRLEREQVAHTAGNGASRTREFALCGPPLPGFDLSVRDESGQILPQRHVGRIFARGPGLMREYLGQPEETRRVFSEDGWLDTGDLGYFTNGQIVITGRAKDLIIVNGRNLWPQDLEWTAETECNALRSGDVAVLSIDREDAEDVVALVQCRITGNAARSALRKEVAGLLRFRHGVDVSVVLVPPHSLPRTSSGKLSRARAGEMFLRAEFAQKAAASAAR
jgi:fatty-acyl-CoA synthase